MIRINAMGEACPLPVVKTLRALQSLGGAGSVETLVDNETAVQNLRRLAESKGCSIEVETISDADYRVTSTAAEAAVMRMPTVRAARSISGVISRSPRRSRNFFGFAA